MAENREAEERYQKAIEHKNDGQYDLAIPEFEQLVGENPEWVEAHLMLGLTYGFVARFDESLAALRRAIELDPDSLDAHLNLAKTLCMLGDYGPARAEFMTVLALQPDHAEAKKQLSYFPPEEPSTEDQGAGGPSEPEADPSSG